MNSILPSFGKDVSIDIGTSMTRVMGGTRETMMSEPSIVATDTKLDKIVAVGDDADRIVRRMPDMWMELTPLQDGFIVDYRVMHTMLKYFLHKVSNTLRRSRVLVGVPCGMTDVEQRAMMDAVIQAGAREVFLIERPVAAAIGSGLPIFEARGSMVIDIGGGTTEVAVLSLNGIVYSSSVRIGGDKLDEAIVAYVRRHFGSAIGEATAERIKKEIATAKIENDDDILEMEVHGHNLAEGAPRTFTLNSKHVLEAIEQPLTGIVDAVKAVLEQCPPELAADIFERGMVLTGGGALLRNLDRLLSDSTGVMVVTAEEPLTCVARGGGKALDMIDMHGGDVFSHDE